MIKLLKTVLKTGDVTVKYPFTAFDVHPGFRGKPELDADHCIACAACARACPSNAIVIETDANSGNRRWELSMARCIYCGRCEEVCPTHAIELSGNFELAVTNKADLYEHADFTLHNCTSCDQPFVAKKLLDYTLACLEQSGLTGEPLAMRRQQLEMCPECRRKSNMLDGENLACSRYLNASHSNQQPEGDQA